MEHVATQDKRLLFSAYEAALRAAGFLAMSWQIVGATLMAAHKHEQPVMLLRPAWDHPQKGAVHAAEQERSDVRAAREDWFYRPPNLDPDRLVFLPETAATTKMVRRYTLATVVSLEASVRMPLPTTTPNSASKPLAAFTAAVLCCTSNDRTRTDAGGGYLQTGVRCVAELVVTLPGAVWLNQYANPDNWRAHYHGLGAEIVREMPVAPTHVGACRKHECAFVHGSIAILDQLAASALEPAYDPVRYRRQAEAALQS